MKPLPVVPNASPASSASPVLSQPPRDPTVEAEDAVASARLKPLIVQAISTVFDPEIPVNIYELGLIYDIAVDSANGVGIRMTLTSPGCPSAQSLPIEVKNKVEAIPGVAEVKVEVVWDPPWDRDRMSEAAKLQLGMF